VADELAMLRHPVSYARLVHMRNAANTINSQLNTRDGTQGLQWRHPTRQLILILCIIFIKHLQTEVQSKAIDASNSFRQPLPEGVVRAADCCS
jgi:hypothetical protein